MLLMICNIYNISNMHDVDLCYCCTLLSLDTVASIFITLLDGLLLGKTLHLRDFNDLLPQRFLVLLPLPSRRLTSRSPENGHQKGIGDEPFLGKPIICLASIR